MNIFGETKLTTIMKRARERVRGVPESSPSQTSVLLLLAVGCKLNNYSLQVLFCKHIN